MGPVTVGSGSGDVRIFNLQVGGCKLGREECGSFSVWGAREAGSMLGRHSPHQ